MAAPVVLFESVWKKFQAGERHDSLRDLVPTLAGRWFRDSPATELKDKEFWALRDVSFSVRPGEGLAIIGPNGAGKSTTLKLLTRIMKPTKGTSLVRGRVGALIEVAAGFLVLGEGLRWMTCVVLGRRLDLGKVRPEIAMLCFFLAVSLLGWWLAEGAPVVSAFNPFWRLVVIGLVVSALFAPFFIRYLLPLVRRK